MVGKAIVVSIIVFSTISCDENSNGVGHSVWNHEKHSIHLPASNYADTTNQIYNLRISVIKDENSQVFLWNQETATLRELSEYFQWFPHSRNGCTTNDQHFFLASIDRSVSMGVVDQIRSMAVTADYRYMYVQCSGYIGKEDSLKSIYHPVRLLPQFIDTTIYGMSVPPVFDNHGQPKANRDTVVLLPGTIKLGSKVYDHDSVEPVLTAYLRKSDVLVLEVSPEVELGSYVRFRDQYFDVLHTKRDSIAYKQYGKPYHNISFKKRRLIRKEVPMLLYEIAPDVQ